MKGKEQEIVAKNSLYTDYRAEFLAAFLIDNGINENEVRIIRNGIAKAGKSVEKSVGSILRISSLNSYRFIQGKETCMNLCQRDFSIDRSV